MAFGYFDDFISDVAMRFAVNGLNGLLIRALDEAKNAFGCGVVPVLQIPYTIFALYFEVSLVSQFKQLWRRPNDAVVNVQEKRHQAIPHFHSVWILAAIG
jgi:hypothetical protein